MLGRVLRWIVNHNEAVGASVTMLIAMFMAVLHSDSLGGWSTTDAVCGMVPFLRFIAERSF